MAMSPDKRKSAVAIILGGMKPKAGKVEDEPAPETGDVGLETAVEEFWSAFEAKDAKAGAAALKSFLEQCHGYDEEPAASPDEEDDEDEDY